MVRISEVSHYWLEDGAPQVAVSGSWLREFGFEIGSKVVIEVVQGAISIKAVTVDEVEGGSCEAV